MKFTVRKSTLKKSFFQRVLKIITRKKWLMKTLQMQLSITEKVKVNACVSLIAINNFPSSEVTISPGINFPTSSIESISEQNHTHVFFLNF